MEQEPGVTTHTRYDSDPDPKLVLVSALGHDCGALRSAFGANLARCPRARSGAKD